MCISYENPIVWLSIEMNTIACACSICGSYNHTPSRCSELVADLRVGFYRGQAEPGGGGDDDDEHATLKSSPQSPSENEPLPSH